MSALEKMFPGSDNLAWLRNFLGYGMLSEETTAMILHAVSTYDARDADISSLRLALTKAQERILALDDTVEKAVAVLRRVAWEAGGNDGYDSCCVDCAAEKRDGHRTGCELATLVGPDAVKP